MIFYLILLTIVLFCCINNSKVGYCFAAMLLTVLAAIRYDVGVDYSQYHYIIDSFIEVQKVPMWEPLTSYVFILPSILLKNVNLFFALTSLFIYSLAFYSFRKFSVLPSLSLIIYLSIFYLISCSIVRQAIALSICLYAYKYILTKSFKKYVFSVLIATLFHYSAFITIFIYFIYHKGSIMRTLVILLSILFLKNLIIVGLSNLGWYTSYLDKLDDIASGRFTFLFYVLIFFSPFYIIKFKHYTKQEKGLLSIVLSGLFCQIIFGTGIGERLAYYFLIYLCYAIPLLLKNKIYFKKYLYICIFSIYFVLTIYITSNIKGVSAAYVPYRTIFNSENIEFRDDYI